MKKASLFFILAFFFFCSSYSHADYDPIRQIMQTNLATRPVQLSSCKKHANIADGGWTAIGPEGTRTRTFETTLSGDTIFLATMAGHLFLSIDGGREWSRRTIITSLYPYLPGVEFVHFAKGIIYIATDLGLYKSADFGVNWQELSTAIEVSFHAIYTDERDANILYAATYRENPSFGGFLKSTDGGKTWNRYNNGLPTTSTDINGNLAPQTALACVEDPADSNRIYLGSFSGLYVSDTQGQNWREITPPAKTPEIRAIAPGADSLLLVGTMYGLFKSNDIGVSWRNASAGLRNLGITDIKIINDSLIYLSTMEGFYISEDAGETWRRTEGVHAFPCTCLAVGENRLFCGTAGAGLYSYTDGQWRDENIDDTYYMINGMAWSPLNHSLYAAYIANYDLTLGKSHSGVLVYSPDKKDSLENLPMNNLYVMSAAPSHFEANTLFLGAMDGVYQTIDNGASWLRAAGLMDQSVSKVAPSPFAANVVLASANNNMNDEDSNKGIFKSEDTGYSFRFSCDLVKEWLGFPYDGGDNWNVRDKLKSGEPFYVNAVCCDPIVDGRVYAGGDALYVSEDAGLSWRTLAELPDGAGRITTMVINPQNPEDIYVGTTANGVLRYDMQPMRVEKEKETPAGFSLAQNYPNPFNSSTAVIFTLPQAARVRISIYNLTGKQVLTAVDMEVASGEHRIVWDGRNEQGQAVAGGVYVLKMTVGNFSLTRKMTLLR